MFKFLGHKLLNKKWLNACLLLGIVLLVAVASCNPMFKNGALDMMLSSKFDDAIEERNEYSAVIGRTGSVATEDCSDIDAVDKSIDGYEEMWNSYLDLNFVEKQRYLYLQGGFATPEFGNRKYFDIGYMENMEDHINIMYGEGLDAQVENGIYPCIISQQALDNYGLVVGEVIDFQEITGANDESLKLKIAGIYDKKAIDDIYWKVESGDNINVFVSKDVFNTLIPEYSLLSIYYEDYQMLDYLELNHSNAMNNLYYLEEFKKADGQFYENFSDILIDYRGDSTSVKIIIWVLELPLIVLLLAFIYMVSSQILEMENNEIAMLKSRGTSTKQVLGIYLGQSAILSFIALFIGIPIGFLLCKLAASANSFLEFANMDTYFYSLDIWMIPYSLAAAFVAILFVTLPVIKYAKNSIVEVKSKTGKVNAKPFWEKFFLDIILVGVSVYLLYNYNKQKSSIALDILSGNKPDPLIFINSSLFIFAVGLLILRLIKYIIKLIYFIGKKRWSPAVYASFLQITRTSKKQGFISVFLVMTIAMGMFNSNMARTINENKIQRLEYNLGTDLVVQEQWKRMTFLDKEKKVNWYYLEDDFERYNQYAGADLESATRVIYDNNTTIKVGAAEITDCLMLGINTKEFGETAELKSGLNDMHWYNYLNEMSQISNGVIISSNLAKKYKLEIGDTIDYARYNPIKGKEDEEIATANGTVCAIVDAFPGYNQYTYKKNEEGEMEEQEVYLVVANYAYAVSAFGLTPYQVWMKLKDGIEYQDVLTKLSDNDMKIVYHESIDKNISKMQESPLVLITNGLFSLSFLIAIILCTVGFLIYWITSIKQRELLFGIYRAMGMSMKEINKMLINEQIFSSVLASLAGYGVGGLASYLFVKLVSIVYLPESHSIAISIVVNPFDIIKLSIVVLLMFIVCFIVIRTILKKMNITQALKLGED